MNKLWILLLMAVLLAAHFLFPEPTIEKAPQAAQSWFLETPTKKAPLVTIPASTTTATSAWEAVITDDMLNFDKYRLSRAPSTTTGIGYTADGRRALYLNGIETNARFTESGAIYLTPEDGSLHILVRHGDQFALVPPDILRFLPDGWGPYEDRMPPQIKFLGPASPMSGVAGETLLVESPLAHPKPPELPLKGKR